MCFLVDRKPHYLKGSYVSEQRRCCYNTIQNRFYWDNLTWNGKRHFYRTEENLCLLHFVKEDSTKSSNPLIHFLLCGLQLQLALDEMLFFSLKCIIGALFVNTTPVSYSLHSLVLTHEVLRKRSQRFACRLYILLTSWKGQEDFSVHTSKRTFCLAEGNFLRSVSSFAQVYTSTTAAKTYSNFTHPSQG